MYGKSKIANTQLQRNRKTEWGRNNIWKGNVWEFSQLVKSTNPQIQETSYTPEKRNAKKNKAKHIIEKLVKIKDKEKTLKSEVKVKH